MTALTLLSHKLHFTLSIALLVGIHILWDYTHGGVPAHHLLADPEMPSISNWWGLITIPLYAWILLTIRQRDILNIESESNLQILNKNITTGFFAGVLFGILISMLWELQLESILQYAILTPLILAFFLRVYRPECVLGFVLFLTYTFGGVLPIFISLFLMIFSFLIYKFLRKGILMLVSGK